MCLVHKSSPVCGKAQTFPVCSHQFGDSAKVYYHDYSTSPKEAISTSCELSGKDTLYGRAGLVDYLIGGGFDDTIEGNDGMDLVFGDHAYLTFYNHESHKLKFATTTNHSCSGGDDLIDLGSGDVRHEKRTAPLSSLLS